MTAYLLKSGLSLLLTFGFYKLCLEAEQMPRFKRAYLLGSLLFSVVVPLLSFTIWPNAPLPVNSPSIPTWIDSFSTAFRPMNEPLPLDDSSPVGWLWLYGIITVGMLTRFARNLYQLTRLVVDNPNQPLQGATLVLLGDVGLPYTFLHYLFVPKAAYDRGDIESELFTHELTHIRQRHSVDVLFVELLICFGWFNPLLFGFKRAIQLNHEFLADEAVNKTHRNVPHYQRLLLSKIAPAVPLRLASALTFQTTKQRFVMMTKHTSARTSWLVGSVAVALPMLLLLVFGTASDAQTPSTNEPAPTQVPGRQPQSVTDLEKRFGDKQVAIPVQPGNPIVRRKFSELSAEEKKRVRYIPPQQRKTPTEAEFEGWKNAKKFGVWVDGKRTRNFAATPLKASDIASYSGSYVHKNARQPEGYLYQMDLMTVQAYEKYLKETEESPFLILVRNEPKQRSR